MKLFATITGSYPPITPPASTEDSIKRAVQDQLDAGLDILVDGQIESDIAGIFAGHMEGFSDRVGRYPIHKKIIPSRQPITVSAFLYAKSLAPGKRFKAHLTGPTFLAQSSEVGRISPYTKNSDRDLIFDIAYALAEEAKALSTSKAEYIQIDEPSFAYGANIETGLEAIEIITKHIKHPILHVCGDIRHIFNQLLSARVEILSVEGHFLRRLISINSYKLSNNKKKIAYGCMPVNIDHVESSRRLVREIVEAIDLYGIENMWAVTPNCGLRLIESTENAQKERLGLRIIKRLSEVAREVERFFDSRGKNDESKNNETKSK